MIKTKTSIYFDLSAFWWDLDVAKNKLVHYETQKILKLDIFMINQEGVEQENLKIQLKLENECVIMNTKRTDFQWKECEENTFWIF